LRSIIGMGRRVTILTCCVGCIWRSFEHTFPIVIYTRTMLLLPAKFKRCVSSDTHVKGSCVSPTLSVDQMWISTVLSWNISPYLCLPPRVWNVHFGVEAFQCYITDEVTNSLIRLTMPGLQYLIGRRYLPFRLTSTTVCSSHWPRA